MMPYPNYLKSLEEAFFPEINNKSVLKSAVFSDGKLSFGDDSDSMATVVLTDGTSDFAIETDKGKKTALHLVVWSDKETDKNISIVLKENSRLDLVVSLLGKGTIRINQAHAFEENSVLESRIGLVRSGKTEYTQKYLLDGRNASVNQILFAVSSGSDRTNITEKVFHDKPDTKSDLNNNLVANGKANIYLEVTGKIEKGMHGSECLQQNRGILLSEIAEIEVDPELLIDEFDVNARHGAAIGQINEEELFYLLSRGITNEEARKLIISGYMGPYLEKLSDTPFGSRIANRIDAKTQGADE